uniref:F-box associated domain-containing protein n=1 Tax=Leersia perrieri TaxID=77586 RepID=A0A0D9X990_9ORYZ
MTLRYAVVHIPCYFDKSGTFDAVQVYTFGPVATPSWREVPAPPGSSGRLQAGAVACVDGSAYWVTAGTPGIMSLDLKDDRVARDVGWLPETPECASRCSYRLTEIRARLCVAVTVEEPPNSMVEVWWLEGTKDQRWTRRYNIQIDTPKQHVMWPLFAHGDHVLTVAQVFNFKEHYLHKHKASDKRSSQCSGEDMEEAAWGGDHELRRHRLYGHQYLFAYMETPEPLEIYGSPVQIKGSSKIE